MLKFSLYPTLPEWSAVAAVYEGRGVAFPMEAVKRVVWGDPRPLLEIQDSPTIPARLSLSKGGDSPEHLAELAKHISELRPGTLSDQDRAVFELRIQTLCAVLRRAAASGEGWEIPPEGEPKAQQVEGAENRAETYSRHLMRNLYSALRPRYDVAWRDRAGDRNTKPIRKHIAIIMAPLDLRVDLSPSGHGPIKYAIDYELKLRKARKQ